MNDKKIPLSERQQGHLEKIYAREHIKPLFIPLKTEYYLDFKDGIKTEELRLYGPRWNEGTCIVGREVVLSKGYGKKDRLQGVIWRFKRQHGTLFGQSYRESIEAVYGTLDIDIACISIKNLEPLTVAKHTVLS